MNFTCVVLGLSFVIFGYLFAVGDIHKHLVAWQQMSEQEKAKIKIIPLCQNIGQMIILAGIIFILAGLWDEFRIHLFVWSMIVWLIISALDLWDITKHKKYEIHE